MPPISYPFPSGRLTSGKPEAGELLGLGQPGVGGGAEALGPQRPAVQCPPLLVRSVRALRPVQDRYLDVELRVTRAGRVLEELRADEPGRVAELAAVRGVVAGADNRSAPLHMPDHGVGARHHGGLDRAGPRFELLGIVGPALFPRGPRGGLEPGVGEADRLLGAERHVVVRRPGPGLRPLLQADFPDPVGHVRGQLAQLVPDPLVDVVLHLLIGALRCVRRAALRGAQRHPARRGVVVVQSPHHVRVDLARPGRGPARRNRSRCRAARPPR